MCDLLRRDTQEVSCLRCVSPLLPFSHEVASDSWWPHGRQHSSVFSPPILPRVCSNSCPLSRWCCITISFSVAPCSFWLQSFRTSGSFPVSWLFTSDGQSKLQHQFFHYSGLISFRTDWFNLLAVQGTLKGLLQKKTKGESESSLASQFKSINFWQSAVFMVYLWKQFYSIRIVDWQWVWIWKCGLEVNFL